MTTAVYERISQDDEQDRHGVQLQRADNLAAAHARGWEVPAELRFADNDVSAYRSSSRPGFEDLCAAIEAGRVERLIVRDYSRLQRSLVRFASFLATCNERGVTIHTLRQGSQEPGASKLQAVLLGTLAEEASRERGQWIRGAALAKAMRGERSGRQRVYGWAGHDVIPEQAAVVAELAQRIVAGESPSSLARDLTARGEASNNMIIRQQDGKEATTTKWNASSVARLVLRPANVGLVVHQGATLDGVRACWPAILDRELWEAACHMLNRPERVNGRTNRRKHLLSGLMRCGVCHEPMVSGVAVSKPRTDADGVIRKTTPTYRCRSYKPCVQRLKEPVDELVSQVVVQLLAREDAHLLLTDGSDAGREAAERANVLRLRRNQIVEEFNVEAGSVTDLVALTKRLDVQIAEAAKFAASATRPPVLRDMVAAVDAASFWEALPLGPRREVVRALLDITVMPSGRRGSRFRPELIRIEMRQ